LTNNPILDRISLTARDIPEITVDWWAILALARFFCESRRLALLGARTRTIVIESVHVVATKH